MSLFSNAEYADILFMYGRADGNAAAARRFYQERFPERRLPKIRVFINTHRQIMQQHHDQETVRSSATSRTPFRLEPGARDEHHRHLPEIDEQILDALAEDPTLSIRQLARQFNLSKSKVWSVLKSENKYPYHYTPVQGLEEGDPVRRVNFCRFILNADIEERHFLNSILWTDESKFSREGITNFHNLHYWSNIEENPHLKKETSFQRKFSVNV
ncbi:uncharacterized protein [Euwallacea similis]|uniref:uncharacterized protein n=1 Tax=Euwallacea similis TaxID=1736056 RepID=UPI003450091A